MPESAPPAIEIIDLPTTSAEEARQKAERAKARLQKPAEPVQAQPPVQAPAPTAPAPQPPQAAPASPAAPPQPKAPVVLDLSKGLPRNAQPTYQSPVAQATTAVASNLATSPTAPETVRSIAAMGADDETQRVLAAQAELRQAGRSRAAQFLAQRGYEEQVSLLPDGIDLSATRKKMEAYGLQQEAKKLGFNNWFEVPQSDERTEAMKDVARRVEMDLARATTVGRGAIFIDPDPAGLRELVGALPLTTGQKMLAGALVPTAKATYSPTGSEFQTESPLAFPMRIVNAVGASVTTPVEAALTEAEPMRRISESRAKVEAGEISHGEYLSDLDTIARDSIKAATGMDLADGVDWRDAFARDPEVQKRLYDRMQTDPAGFMVANQLADDLVEYFDAPSTLTHLLLVPTGFAWDVVTPDPATPMLGLAAQAAKAGARLSGDTNDLLKAARALRAGAAEEGADLGRVMGAARENYNGLEEALAIRVGSRARVPTEVAAQVRRLEMEADEAAQAVQRAQERAGDAVDEQERFAATLEVLTTQQAAARARLDLAEAQAALADDANDIYKTVGAPAVKKSERMLKASEDARAEARGLEDEVAALQQENELGLGRLQAQNEALHEAMLRRDEAAGEVRAAQEALQQARAAKKTPAATVPEEVASLEAQVIDAKKALDREAAELAEQRKRLAILREDAKKKGVKLDPSAAADVEAQKARVAQRRADYDLLIEQRALAREQQAKEAAAARVNAQVEAGAAAQRLDAAKAKVAAADEELQQVNKTRQRALKDVEKPLAAMKARADRALEMHRRAAELEQESAEGIRLITTGTDIPGERGAVADVGARVAAMREAAQRELAAARDEFRQADSAANRGSRAAARAAEDEIRRIEGMMGAQMRADLLRERATLWREEARALADDIENGVAGLRSRRKVDPRHNGILMGAVLDEGRNGYVIDADAFRAKVEQEYSPEAVRWWVERAGDDRDLWVRALGLDGRGKTVLTKREALLLQQGEKGLMTGLERTRPAAAAEAQVEALLLLRRDPARKAAAFFDTNPKAWGEYVGNSLDTWVRALDPTAARIGEVNADVEQISRAANRMASNARDELLMLNRLAKLPQGFKGIYQASMRGFGSPQAMIDISLRYIDSTEPLEVFGRHTILNTGDETLWQRAKRQFQTDPRVATHDQMVQYATSKGLSLEEMLASDQPGISNRPLLGLSRMWLKSGTGASERQSAYLFGEARRLIATSNSYQEFSDAMKKATQRAWTDGELAGGGGFGPGAIEVHPQRAIGYGARNVAQAAVQGDVNDLFVRGLGGIFTPEEANDAIKAATYNFDTIADPGNVWQTYARLGAPYTQRSLRDAESAVARTQALLQTGTTRSGEPVFMLSSQARALDETLDKVVKETHAQYAGARDLMSAWNLKHIGDFQQFWKTSVTLGLLVPRPSYFMTNIFGNFSQMWLSAGLGTAARISFQSLPYNIPFVGPVMDKAMRMTSERLGNVPHLGSITNAWVNPHINRVFAGEQGLFRAKNGIEYDFETVRKWMVEDGVMTSFMQEEFGRLFARAQGDGMMTRLSFLQDDIFSWAGEIELRMRAALYMDMLRKGATRGDAREVTLRALYDWEGALGKTEAQVFTWFIPFYRFIKLGLRQWGQEAISLPLRRPIESTYKAAMGQSGLARVNQQMKVTTFPELADDGDYQDDQQKWDAMSRYRGLDYLTGRVYWAERNDLELQALYQGTRGQFMPYSMTALPGLTAIDMGALAVLPFYALGVVGLKAASIVEPRANNYLAPDWPAAFFDAAVKVNGPLTQPLIAAWAESSGNGTQRSAEAVRLSPGEAALAKKLGLPTFVGKDYQGIYGTAATKAIIGNVPGLLQVPSWLNAFAYENPYVDNLRLDQDDPQGPAAGIANYFAFGAKQISGAGRAYPFDPMTTEERRRKGVGAQVRKDAERQGAPLREKQLPKP